MKFAPTLPTHVHAHTAKKPRLGFLYEVLKNEVGPKLTAEAEERQREREQAQAAATVEGEGAGEEGVGGGEGAGAEAGAGAGEGEKKGMSCRHRFDVCVRVRAFLA